MNILENISEILNWYSSLPSTESIDSLIDSRDKLAVYSFRLAEMCSDSKTDYNKLYFLRKIAVTRATQSLLSRGLAFNKAEAESLLRHEQEYRKELMKESEAYKYDLLLKQVNKVLDAMSQKISYLKIEKNKYDTGSSD